MLAESPVRRPIARAGHAVWLPVLAGASLWGSFAAFVIRGDAPPERGATLIPFGSGLCVLAGTCWVLVRRGRPPRG